MYRMHPKHENHPMHPKKEGHLMHPMATVSIRGRAVPLLTDRREKSQKHLPPARTWRMLQLRRMRMIQVTECPPDFGRIVIAVLLPMFACILTMVVLTVQDKLLRR